MSVVSRRLEYAVSWNRRTGCCMASVWRPPVGRLGLVVVSELASNPGPSVTNAIEDIAAALEASLFLGFAGGWRSLDHYHLVEHYPATSRYPATYDRVTLTRGADPEWRRLSLDELDALAPSTPAPSASLEQILLGVG